MFTLLKFALTTSTPTTRGSHSRADYGSSQGCGESDTRSPSGSNEASCSGHSSAYGASYAPPSNANALPVRGSGARYPSGHDGDGETRTLLLLVVHVVSGGDTTATDLAVSDDFSLWASSSQLREYRAKDALFTMPITRGIRLAPSR